MITEISKGNKALKYIETKIASPNYRGSVSSEHNRYMMDDVIKILELLDKYAPENSLMLIRDTDISKRPHNTPDEYAYSCFCDEVKSIIKKGSQDAMRKNLFVDFHRMGFIRRFDRSQNETDPYKTSHIKYVSLSGLGEKLIKAENRLNRFYIFSKGIDNLLGGSINTLIEIFSESDYDLNYLSVYEYMFFVSSVYSTYDFQLSISECVELVKSYRHLSTIQKSNVIAELRQYMQPCNFSGNKTDKRDFHNWENKIQQIYHLLNQTSYFSVSKENNDTRLTYIGPKNDDLDKVRYGQRLSQTKLDYLKTHKLNKRKGFEFHHIVPLSWAESAEEFKLLEEWRNLLYIDGYNHSKISQNKNMNVFLSKTANDLILTDFKGNAIMLKYDENVAYSPKLLSAIIEYNHDLVVIYYPVVP